jgi:hypothetical protein
MRIVEIVALDNGAHRNQTTDGVMNTIPEGWAIVPETLDTPNFPFGNITVDEQTPPVVLTWEPLPIPEPEPEPDVPDEPAEDESVWDELDKAYTEGVNGAYDQ